MRLSDMTVLVRVAETGSMTAGARQLHLTPAAVSSRVLKIEGELGLRVFERTTRSLHTTDEGRVVVDGCREVLDRWQQTLEAARDDHADLSGTVHVSAPSDTSYGVLSDVVATLCAAHPALRVVLDISDAIQHLHREHLDIAIRYGALRDSGLVARRLTAQPNVLVASPAYLATHAPPKRVEDLRAHRLLTLQLSSRPTTSWTLTGPGGEHTVPLDSPLCADGYQVRRWARSGQGIAQKNLVDVIDDLESGALVRVLPEVHGGAPPIHAMFPSRRAPPARVRAVDRAIALRFAALEARCDAWLDLSGA